jgi:antitoxin component of MazEF toxin-antitoxin module
MTRATLGRWDKSLAVRFPAEVAKAAGFGEGERIEIIGRRGEIVIRKAPSSALATMFAGKSAEEWRELYAGTAVWGPDMGREIVEE